MSNIPKNSHLVISISNKIKVYLKPKHEIEGGNILQTADVSFTTADDKSNAANGTSYKNKNKNNLPCVLNIGHNVPYTKEGQDITSGYLKLAAWAASGGSLFADGYLNRDGYRNASKLY